MDSRRRNSPALTLVVSAVFLNLWMLRVQKSFLRWITEPVPAPAALGGGGNEQKRGSFSKSRTVLDHALRPGRRVRSLQPEPAAGGFLSGPPVYFPACAFAATNPGKWGNRRPPLTEAPQRPARPRRRIKGNQISNPPKRPPSDTALQQLAGWYPEPTYSPPPPSSRALLRM